jgi:hypothetical protein
MRLSHNGNLELMLTHSETLSVAAMRVCNPDRSPVGIHIRDAAPLIRTGQYQNRHALFPCFILARESGLQRYTGAEAPGVEPGSRRKMMQSTTHRAVHAFAQARFAFSTQVAVSSV